MNVLLPDQNRHSLLLLGIEFGVAILTLGGEQPNWLSYLAGPHCTSNHPRRRASAICGNHSNGAGALQFDSSLWNDLALRPFDPK